MPITSEARINANRQNAQRSSGPKTPEGKAISRRNGLKHGLTGAGIVIPAGDGSAVDGLAGVLRTELDPRSTLGKVLIGQLATLSIRLERSSKQEEEALASRTRHAADSFDRARVDRAELLFETIAEAPRRHLLELKRTPEGVDRLLEAWGWLRSVLTRSEVPSYWDASHHATLANLIGFRPEEVRGTRLDRLSMAVQSLGTLDEPQWVALDWKARKTWAGNRLLERIDEQVAELENHRETLDLEAIDLDRLGAARLAPFDPSHEATLARRYEAEARRGFFKTLEQFHHAEAEVEAEVAAEIATPAEPAVEVSEPAPADPALGSSCAEGSTAPSDLDPIRSVEERRAARFSDRLIRRMEERRLAVGKAAVDPS